MVTLQPAPALQQSLFLADQMLRAGDPDGADRLLTPLLERFATHPKLLHLAGLIRMHQQRHQEAAGLFARARAADPREAVLAFSHGTALRWLEQHGQAAQAFRDATKLKPDYAEAYYEAGTILQQLGDLPEAEAVFRQWLDAMPGQARGQLALADLLIARKRPQEAEPLLR
ncbi:MAG: tetratricopeptide repeat protein, partial [Rhizomicrobium sp.]